jgi:tripartite-type tricarboxylate transporter receptor subunit TctC
LFAGDHRLVPLESVLNLTRAAIVRPFVREFKKEVSGGNMSSKLSGTGWLAALFLVIQSILLLPGAMAAEKWPTRPVRWILPFGPGSGADNAARLLSDKLQAIWDQPVVIENKPGGDGIISVSSVVTAKDDHVLFFGPTSAYVVQTYQHGDMGYDPEKDLKPIAGVAKVQIAIAVPTSLGVTTLKQFVTLSKEHPDKVSYAVAPGFSEFVFDGFCREQGLNIAKVLYRDITTSPMDLGENRIQLSMQSYAAMRSFAQGGKIKIIAISDTRRSPIAPDIQSVVEEGYPSLVASPILGLLGPSDLLMALREKIANDVITVLKDKTIGERMALLGQPLAPMGVEAFTAAVNEQYVQVAHIASLLGMKRK